MLEQLYRIFCQYPNVCTDSRSVTEGCIFFALRGERFNGNLFARQAVEQGAVLAVIDDTSVCPDSSNFMVVSNVLETLQQLAAMHRRKLGIPVIGITGTNGKTTTKELMAAVLSRKFVTASTRGNLNNHIGVPLTILSFNSSVQMAVVEMGASSRGEIAASCRIAQPDYGLITNIGRAHLEGFGGVEGIRAGKGELYDWLVENHGLAFVRNEDEVLMQMAAEREMLNTCPYPTSCGEGMKSNLEGDYNALNIAAAVAVGRYFGVDDEQIEQAVACYEPTNHRSQRLVTASNQLVVDCYNANPSSMAAAIDNFDRIESDGLSKVIILGDMLELGRWSREEHIKVLERAVASSAVKIMVVGKEFCQAAQQLDNKRVQWFDDLEALQKRLVRYPLREKMVLVKGSHGMGLERLTDIL